MTHGGNGLGHRSASRACRCRSWVPAFPSTQPRPCMCTYRESIERLARSRAAVELGRSRLLYGEWLRRENRRTDAREPVSSRKELRDVLADGSEQAVFGFV